MDNLKFIKVSGSNVDNLLTDLGKLRIAVFYEFPYLYKGNLDYEREYLQVYVRTPESLVFAVYDNDQMVGATTAIPLKHETNEIKQSIIEAGYEVDKIFYFGESILLPEYRGFGLGHRFFDEREQFALSFGSYHTTIFCGVDRPDKHSLKPQDYRSNEAFWKKRGYQKYPELNCRISWIDRGDETESQKRLTFWMKKWK